MPIEVTEYEGLALLGDHSRLSNIAARLQEKCTGGASTYKGLGTVTARLWFWISEATSSGVLAGQDVLGVRQTLEAFHSGDSNSTERLIDSLEDIKERVLVKYSDNGTNRDWLERLENARIMNKLYTEQRISLKVVGSYIENAGEINSGVEALTQVNTSIYGTIFRSVGNIGCDITVADTVTCRNLRCGKTFKPGTVVEEVVGCGAAFELLRGLDRDLNIQQKAARLGDLFEQEKAMQLSGIGSAIARTWFCVKEAYATDSQREVTDSLRIIAANLDDIHKRASQTRGPGKIDMPSELDEHLQLILTTITRKTKSLGHLLERLRQEETSFELRKATIAVHARVSDTEIIERGGDIHNRIQAPHGIVAIVAGLRARKVGNVNCQITATGSLRCPHCGKEFTLN